METLRVNDMPPPTGQPIPTPLPPAPKKNLWDRMNLMQRLAVIAGAALVFVIIASSASEGDVKKPDRTSSKKSATKTKKKLTPIQALEADVRKNAIDEVGKDRVQSAMCERIEGAVWCGVSYRVGSTWDASEDEVARDLGGMLHELFRDTKVNDLTVNGLMDVTDELGNETKDFTAMTINMKRGGWNQVDWDNLKVQDPTRLQDVSEFYVFKLTD